MILKLFFGAKPVDDNPLSWVIAVEVRALATALLEKDMHPHLVETYKDRPIPTDGIYVCPTYKTLAREGAGLSVILLCTVQNSKSKVPKAEN